MSFALEAAKSVSDSRVLVEIDVGQTNIQWVNNGAGLWAVDAENLYSWVDETLLETGFSAQEFGVIGSVTVDALPLTDVDTLAAITTTDESFYYDKDDRMLTLSVVDNDEPSLHHIVLGVIFGYSFDEFTPIDSKVPYEGRLLGLPSISITRAPLFYGLLSHGGGAIRLANADGALDTFARDSDGLYGNPARVYIGFPELVRSDYQQIYVGYIDRFSVNELEAVVSIADPTKQLSKPGFFSVASIAPVLLIIALLGSVPGIPYSAKLFDQDSFVNALAFGDFKVGYDSSYASYNDKKKPLIEFIEQICAAGFINFWISADGKFTATVVNNDATTSETVIRSVDIMNNYTVVYDPSEVVSSVEVKHSPRYTANEVTYEVYTDTTREASAFSATKTYREHRISTQLETEAEAALWATKFMDMHAEAKGTLNVEVPLKYYDIDIGDIVFVEVNRTSKTMLGTVLSSITSKTWNVSDVPTLSFGIRFL